MNEILNSYLPAVVVENVYPPMILVAYIAVEWLRYQFPHIDTKIKPKHLTLVVGLIVAVASYYLETLEGVSLDVRKLIVTYFVMTIAYEYAIKPIKEKFFPKFVEKQKE